MFNDNIEKMVRDRFERALGEIDKEVDLSFVSSGLFYKKTYSIDRTARDGLNTRTRVVCQVEWNFPFSVLVWILNLGLCCGVLVGVVYVVAKGIDAIRLGVV